MARLISRRQTSPAAPSAAPPRSSPSRSSRTMLAPRATSSGTLARISRSRAGMSHGPRPATRMSMWTRSFADFSSGTRIHPAELSAGVRPAASCRVGRGLVSTRDLAAGAEDILRTPRGRRLCWSLVDIGLSAQGDPAWTGSHDVWTGAYHDDLPGLASALGAWVQASDPTALAQSTDELGLLAALAQAVDSAMYWQPPDEADQALADTAVREALAPIARAVATAPAARWWTSAAPPDRQQYVQWTDDHGSPLEVTGAARETGPTGARITRNGRPGGQPPGRRRSPQRDQGYHGPGRGLG